MKNIFFILLITLNAYAYDAFISAKKLHEIVGEKDLLVIDISDSYKTSHIVDAYGLDVDTLVKTENTLSLKTKKR